MPAPCPAHHQWKLLRGNHGGRYAIARVQKSAKFAICTLFWSSGSTAGKQERLALAGFLKTIPAMNSTWDRSITALEPRFAYVIAPHGHPNLPLGLQDEFRLDSDL
ncbi:hypothetical protein DFH09DRAFT_1342232 [Mycena vulgaris]|nr:hypothetical protein DFH09DRAFT_1342232 [Mycena vulgaris]